MSTVIFIFFPFSFLQPDV